MFAQDQRSLEVIPEEQYALLGNLLIYVEDIFRQGSLLPGIVNQQPNLIELIIYESYDDKNADGQRRLNHFLTQLLHPCQESLRDLNIYNCAFNTLTLLRHIPLRNLLNFSLETKDETRLDELWNALGSIDGHNMMPKLAVMELTFQLSGPEGASREWPPNNPSRPSNYSYSRVRKLSLDLQYVSAINFLEIKAVFPNVIFLELSWWSSENVPWEELLRLWPYLHKLKINAMDRTLRKR